MCVIIIHVLWSIKVFLHKMNKSSALDVIERLKEIHSANSDTELCKAIDVNRQTLSNWKMRDTVPYPLCVQVAKKEGVTLDWLLTGEGPMHRDHPAGADTALTSREEALLDLFRALDDGTQREIQQVAEEKKRLKDIEQQIKELQVLLPPRNGSV